MNCAWAQDIQNVSELDIESLKTLENLNELSMNFCTCKQLADIAPLGTGLQRLENLQQLDLNFRRCMLLADVSPLGDGLKTLQKLQRLNLDFCTCRHITDVSSLGMGLQKLKNLEHLDMNFRRCVLLCDIESLGAGLTKLRKLKELTLIFCGTDVKDVSGLAKALEALDKLERLELCFRGSVKNIQTLAPSIARLQALKSLDLMIGFHQFTSQNAFQAFVDADLLPKGSARLPCASARKNYDSTHSRASGIADWLT